MAPKFDFIEDINPFKETWKIRVRVSTLWNTPKFNSFGEVNSIDMILLDEKSGIIQATIKKALLNKFKNHLHEGKSYVITNFGVGENSGNYKATHHNYRVNFLYSTSVKECDESMLPVQGFHFTTFDDIISRRADDTFLVDVIGELIAAGKIEESENAGKTSKRMVIELQDEQKKKLSCTLWGHYADEIASYVSGELQTPFVIILHLGRIKLWKGVTTLTNSYFTTKIICDQNMPQVVDFKNRLCCEDGFATQTISQILPQTSHSIREDFLQLSERKFLDEVREMRQIGVCVTLATIVKIETEFNWFYNSCKNCRKKVKPDGGKFWCEICCEYARVVLPRYKIQIRVIDHTGSASFVIFDREAMQFLHKSAAYLRDQLIKDGDSDSFPKELDYFLEKKFLFKIQISEYNLRQNWPIYTVSRMCDDASIIDTYLATSNIIQDAEDHTDFDHSVIRSNTVGDVENDALSVSCSSDSLTPMKRITADNLNQLNSSEDLTPAQLSCNKKKQIKVEKNEIDNVED